LNKTEQDRLLGVMRDKLYVAVVSDILDANGLHNQAMDARLRPLTPTMRLIGRAHTVLTADIYEEVAEPYRMEIEAVDALEPGDIVVASTGRSLRTCFWGELLSTAAVARGALGCAIDGYVRDALKIIDMDFPVFTTGFRPVDSRTRSTVVAYDVAVECGGVLVHPGDIIFGDYDGIVVIPQDRLTETVEGALAKVEGENNARVMLRQGYKLRDVYDRYGVL
jgi:regulator of RNase E activity RraA